MARNQESPLASPEALIVAIEELRRANDELSHSYNTAKSRSFTFIAGGLGLLAFLYSGKGIFMPQEIYGQILYAMGLGLMGVALLLLLAAILGRRWELSLESRDLDKMDFRDDEHFLKYVKDRNMYAYKCNIAVYGKTQKYLGIALNPLIVGAIILLVMKIFSSLNLQ